jgi:hypothetical protein
MIDASVLDMQEEQIILLHNFDEEAHCYDFTKNKHSTISVRAAKSLVAHLVTTS